MPSSILPSPPPVATKTVTHTLTMNSGWTWISSPEFKTVAKSSLNDVFGNLGGLATKETDILKNQFHFSNYVPGFGWFGQLSTLAPTECYKVRLSTGGAVSFTGVPADMAGTSIKMNAGWTWIGWPSMSSGDIAATFQPALTRPEDLDSQHDLVKSQFNFATHIPGHGWFGNLDTFEPGLGYMVKLSKANTLTNFGIVGVPSRAKRKLEPVRSFKAESPAVVGSGAWQMAPSTFEYSMCIVAVVINEGAVVDNGDLAAFVDGQLRGIARPSSHRAPVGTYKGHRLYNLMAYGQEETEGATITFQYRHANGRVVALEATTAFVKEKLVGTVTQPYVIEHAALSAATNPETELSAANPISPSSMVAPEAKANAASVPSPVTIKSTTLSMPLIAVTVVSAVAMLLCICFLRLRRMSSTDRETASAYPVAVVVEKASINAA